MANNTMRDVAEGVVGALGMVLAYVTPMMRDFRSHWGLTEEEAARPLPGDQLVPTPRWQWTHGIRIEAPVEEAWPWIVQIGQGRAGFYSYQWLENIAGCEVENAVQVMPGMQSLKPGDKVYLHPKAAPMEVAGIEPFRYFVLHLAGDIEHGGPLEPGKDPTGRYVAVSWLFYLEPLPDGTCRFISRYRCDCSDDLRTRAQLGEATIEPIGFVMDRRMLIGVKERVEAARKGRLSRLEEGAEA